MTSESGDDNDALLGTMNEDLDKLRQIVSVLRGMQNTQTEMIKDLHLSTLPGKFTEIEMKKNDGGWWGSGHFVIKGGKGEESNWELLLVSGPRGVATLRLSSWNPQKIVASADYKILGEKIQMKVDLFEPPVVKKSVAVPHSNDASMQMNFSEFNRQMKGFDSFKMRVAIDIHCKEGEKEKE